MLEILDVCSLLSREATISLVFEVCNLLMACLQATGYGIVQHGQWCNCSFNGIPSLPKISHRVQLPHLILELCLVLCEKFGTGVNLNRRSSLDQCRKNLLVINLLPAEAMHHFTRPA